MVETAANVAAGDLDGNTDTGVDNGGDKDDSNASKAKTKPIDRPSQLVMRIGRARQPRTVHRSVPNPFVRRRDSLGVGRRQDAPGVRHYRLPGTNVYLKSYNRAYVSDSGVMWRLRALELGTLSNGEVGGGINRHPFRRHPKVK